MEMENPTETGATSRTTSYVQVRLYKCRFSISIILFFTEFCNPPFITIKMTTSTKNHRQFLHILGEILFKSDDQPIDVSISKLRGINVISITELKQALGFAQEADIVRIVNARLFDGGKFEVLQREKVREESRGKGILYIHDTDNMIRDSRIEYFFSGRHTWDMRDKLDIEINPNNLERELQGKLIDEFKELILVNPHAGIMPVVVNGNYQISIPCKIKVPAWKALYDMARGEDVPYTKETWDYLNNPKNIIFSRSRLPYTPLVQIKNKFLRLREDIQMKLISEIRFRGRKKRLGRTP